MMVAALSVLNDVDVTSRRFLSHFSFFLSWFPFAPSFFPSIFLLFFFYRPTSYCSGES